MKLHKGDEIVVTAGKDRGKHGKIEQIYPKLGRVLIPGVNLYKKHLKAKSQNEPGGIVDTVRPLPLSNIALICPHCGKPTRIGFQGVGKTKERICKKCHKGLNN